MKKFLGIGIGSRPSVESSSSSRGRSATMQLPRETRCTERTKVGARARGSVPARQYSTASSASLAGLAVGASGPSGRPSSID